MRRLVLFLVAWLLAEPGHADSPVVLEGEWKLTGMIYHGHLIPPLNPNLNLRWTFFANGTDRLYWDRTGESGFCERFAHYTIQDNLLHEKVFAVNSRNNPDCAKDPDMQMDRKTANPVEFQQNQILLHLQMGDEELIYVLEEVP